MGIAGWFLLMVTGVGSRLIPMFLISKYNKPRLLWIVYVLINIGLIFFVVIHIYFNHSSLYLVSFTCVVIALAMFAFYCRQAHKLRIRRQVDRQMKISLLSAGMITIPLIILLVTISLLQTGTDNTRLVSLYGFVVFFGWITAIIFGMTFKTLPFIIWNKVYHAKAGLGKTPNPKELFSDQLFTAMAAAYLFGFMLFAVGILSGETHLLKAAALLLLLAALLYNFNVFIIIFHKAHTHGGDYQQ